MYKELDSACCWNKPVHERYYLMLRISRFALDEWEVHQSESNEQRGKETSRARNMPLAMPIKSFFNCCEFY